VKSVISYVALVAVILTVYSCFEIVGVEIQNAPEESFPFIEVIYNSNSGWHTVFDKTKILNKVNTDTVELEYFQLYENGVVLYSWSQDTSDILHIDYEPKTNMSYSIKVKFKGFEEIRSNVQTMYTKPILDTCYQLGEIIVCHWESQDEEAGYYIQYTKPWLDGRNIPHPDIIRSSGSELPELMNYAFDTPFRDSSTDITLNRLSDGLINFYESIEEYQLTYDDGTTDPGWIYTNLTEGYGVFGFIAQSDTLRLDIK